MDPPAVLSAPHAATIQAAADSLGVDPARGLAAEEARRRLGQHGRNELRAQRPPSLAHMVWEAVTEPFVVLLLLAGLLAVALGEVRDGLLVLLGLIPIVGADVITGYRGERALQALRETAQPLARVRRDGQVKEILAAEVVPGDVVLLGAGDVVPADVRLTRADALLVERAILTGESLPEPASVEPDDPSAGLTERRAMAFSGTNIVQGRGEGLAVATGPRSELGRIAARLGARERRRSPVQQELDRLVRILLTVALGLVAITSGLALIRAEPLGVAVLAGVAAAIAAIPEEPPVMLAVILGLGALRMLRRGVLVRRLNAQETLSAVDLILTDKTGTLTHNRLRLEPALTPAGALSGTELRAAVEAAYRAQGDAWHREAGARPTSFTRAIASSLEEAGGVPTLDPADLLEFDPPGDRPYTRTLSRNGNGNGNGDGDGGGEARELLLGAPEAILALIRDSSRGNGAGAGGNSLDDWRQLVEDRADAGQRLLLLAEGRAGETLQPRALLPFSDPLRDDVPEALKLATDAGIQTIVVTGDHPLTAGRIAAGAGLPAGLAVTGDELATWTDEQVRRRLGELRIVARALPEQKLRLVELARAGGRTVAVTGDGVNDAPALQHADVAVAMGSGAAVARQAADLVLGDDSFATLMHGLREGRRMVTNIQKGLVFLISTHVALLGFILVATVYGFSQPLLPIHILWLEFFIDVTASIAFERESEEPGQMRIPPRPRGQPLLTTGLLVRISGAGGWTALAALVLMAIHQGQPDEARWLAFNVLVVGQLMRAYANRSLTNPVTRLGANRFLLVISVVALAVQVVIPYVPALADAFRATPLDAGQWLMVVMIALAPAVLAELVRSFRGRLWVA